MYRQILDVTEERPVTCTGRPTAHLSTCTKAVVVCVCVGVPVWGAGNHF